MCILGQGDRYRRRSSIGPEPAGLGHACFLGFPTDPKDILWLQGSDLQPSVVDSLLRFSSSLPHPHLYPLPSFVCGRISHFHAPSTAGLGYSYLLGGDLGLQCSVQINSSISFPFGQWQNHFSSWEYLGHMCICTLVSSGPHGLPGGSVGEILTSAEAIPFAQCLHPVPVEWSCPPGDFLFFPSSPFSALCPALLVGEHPSLLLLFIYKEFDC